MVAPVKTIVISGYYGFRNSGDEAVLKSILTALARAGNEAGIRIEPVVLSIDPEWTTSMYGVKAVHRMKLAEVRSAIQQSDGLISGGGSLLQDVTSPKTIPYYLGVLKLAQWAKKPTFIYAQGVGPVQRKIFYPLIKSVFRKAAYISVRDEQSADLLSNMGIARGGIEVVPDPVMGLPLPEDTSSLPVSESSNLPTIGVSVRYWDKERRELSALARGLRQLGERQPVHIRLLPFHLPDDVEASHEVMALVGSFSEGHSQISIAEDVLDPQQMLLEVSRCDLVIGMRLHSLIYAASRSIPLLGISYDPKIDHFLKRLGSEPVGNTTTLAAEQLAAEAERIIKAPMEWLRSREAKIRELQKEARRPAERIVHYLRNKG
ncbi:colanic acid biosynthesis protein [compost metagenome]